MLRTNALSLAIAPAGQQVDLATGTPIAPNTLPTGQGSQNVIIGKSGGEANLFGNIPGKSYGIDVTVSLATKINSIFRIQDQDVFDTPLLAGSQYPAGIFNCRQIWSGAVQNYIPGVRLTGNLRISPAITKDGKLRIAKATVSTTEPDHVALSACLMPYRSYSQDNTAGLPDDRWRRWPGTRPRFRRRLRQSAVRRRCDDRRTRAALQQQPLPVEHGHACSYAVRRGVQRDADADHRGQQPLRLGRADGRRFGSQRLHHHGQWCTGDSRRRHLGQRPEGRRPRRRPVRESISRHVRLGRSTRAPVFGPGPVVFRGRLRDACCAGEQPEPLRALHRLGAVADLELAIQRARVLLDGVRREEQRAAISRFVAPEAISSSTSRSRSVSAGPAPRRLRREDGHAAPTS